MRDLAGRRVMVTRSREDCGEWAAELERLGMEPVILPCITTRLIDTPALRAGLAAAAPRSDWLIFTSRRGVTAFASLHPRASALKAKIAVVGSGTAETARARLGHVEHVDSGGTAAMLGDSLTALPAFAPGMQCLIAVAANASTLLERKLAAAGAACPRFEVYRTYPTRPRRPKRRLSALRADTILFASPSAVEGFVNQVELDAAADVLTMGPSTSAAARAYGLTITGEARQRSLEGLLEAIHGE